MAQLAPVTPPRQTIPDYSMNPSPSHSPHPPTSDASDGCDRTKRNRHQENNLLPNNPTAHRSRSSSPSTVADTDMATTSPPFEVPKQWQTAMSMVSINAGLFPQEVLQHYYRLYPLQVAAHPRYTELDVWRSRRARGRGVRALRVHHANADPSRIAFVLLVLDELDPVSRRPVSRLITNTSIRHVLGEPCSNCPLWLPVREVNTILSPSDDSKNQNTDPATATAVAAAADDFNPASLLDPYTATPTPYQIIPCCPDWAASADFEAPISDEEKMVPQLVDRLLDEVRRRNAELAAKNDEIAQLLEQQQQLEQKQQLRQQQRPHENENGRNGAPAPATAVGQVHAAIVDAEALVQYWWAGAAFVLFCVVLLFR